MTVKRHAPIAVALLASGWIAGGIAAPAMASDANSHLYNAVPQVFMNQGPHGFGNPAATGGVATGGTGAPGFVNQGPHGFGDPNTSGLFPTEGATVPSRPLNPGPHTLG